jgi:hypothetical protein
MTINGHDFVFVTKIFAIEFFEEFIEIRILTRLDYSLRLGIKLSFVVLCDGINPAAER